MVGPERLPEGSASRVGFVFGIGKLTFAALLRKPMENVVLLRHMQDIRSTGLFAR